MTYPIPDAIVVRPPATDDETAAFFDLTAAQFIRGAPLPIAASDLRRYVYDAPNADPANVRGAFHGHTCLGGYLYEERWLRIGAARIAHGLRWRRRRPPRAPWPGNRQGDDA